MVKLSLSAPCRPAAEVEIRTHTLYEMEVSDRLHTSAVLSQGEDLEPLRQKTGWAPELLRREKYLAPTWMRKSLKPLTPNDL
jgi:hypothetical protein